MMQGEGKRAKRCGEWQGQNIFLTSGRDGYFPLAIGNFQPFVCKIRESPGGGE